VERDPRDILVADLEALGRAVRPSLDEAVLTEAVLTRVAALPAPSAARAPVPRPRRRLVLVATAVLLALLVTPPVRAAVADWFGFAGVVVRHGPSLQPSHAPPPPTAPTTMSLDQARRLAAFDVAVPADLGAPDGVEVSADHRVLSMTWTRPATGTVRLDQFDGRLDYTFAKSAPGVEFTSVSGSTALWFDRPHRVVLLGPDGSRRRETARLGGQTLIWERGATTLRLEGELGQQQAVTIAESVPPAG
jgi:hypothetical protein